MPSSSAIPRFPKLGARVLRAMPAAPLSFLLEAIASKTAEDHPGLFARLGPHAEKCFLVDPIDLPIRLSIHPRRSGPKVKVLDSSATPPWDCRIAGPLALLLGMVHGAYDADALLFSRDIVLEGDTEAGLALRNALDDAEIDLCEETLRSLGMNDGLVKGFGQPAARTVGRVLGVALTRVEDMP